MEGFIVRFKNSHRLGLDDYDVTSYAVVPASRALTLLESPRGVISDLLHEDTVRMLKGLGDAMVEVKGFGICCGDYYVQPYLLSHWEWEILRNAKESFYAEKELAWEG